MMTVQYRILKSHINKDGIKVIDKLKIESVDFHAWTIKIGDKR